MPHAHDIVAAFIFLFVLALQIYAVARQKGWGNRLSMSVLAVMMLTLTSIPLLIVVAPEPPEITIKAGKELRAGDPIYLSYALTSETGRFQVRTPGEDTTLADDRGTIVLVAQEHMEIELLACRTRWVGCISQTLTPPVVPAPSSYIATGWNWQRSAPRDERGWHYERSSRAVANPRRAPVAVHPHDWHKHV